MAQSWAINANGDLYRDANGNMAIVSGADAVGQNCVTAMRAQRGEMQYNLQGGMPMGATAFDTYNPSAFEATARKVLSAVDGVISVTTFNVTRNSNALDYSATIETIYGQTFISSSVNLV